MKRDARQSPVTIIKPFYDSIALTSNGVAAYHALLAHYKGETDSRRTAAFDVFFFHKRSTAE
jgi:hypothetical protein